ncbi:MAG TPA: hypothetical protein VFX95_03370 [Caulobacteraceae bacterium]|nr:hypothetical protein [Caulobacteraceae bacterium]
MKKASEYRQHADECRALASRMDLGEHRDQLLKMAATWDQLAAERAQHAKRQSDGRPDEPRGVEDQ